MIRSIIGIPFTVNKAFGMPSDNGLSLVASPPTNKYNVLHWEYFFLFELWNYLYEHQSQ